MPTRLHRDAKRNHREVERAAKAAATVIMFLILLIGLAGFAAVYSLMVQHQTGRIGLPMSSGNLFFK
jgi:hypothetical protein